MMFCGMSLAEGILYLRHSRVLEVALFVFRLISEIMDKLGAGRVRFVVKKTADLSLDHPER